MKQKTSFTWKQAVMIGIITALGMVGGKFAFNYLSHESIADASRIDQSLIQTSREINKILPLIVDSVTRLDTTVALPGNQFGYEYTLLNLDYDKIDLPELKKEMRSKLIASYQTKEDMNAFREMKVILNYSYKKVSGEELFEISISPDDFEPEQSLQ